MTTFYYPPSPTVVAPPGGATEATLAAFSAKVNDNYGVATGAVRTASQIGNTTGAADFGSGTTSAQTLRTVLVTDQTPIPVTSTPAVKDFGITTNAERVASVLGTATGALSASNPAIVELSDGAATYTTVKTAQVPTALGQTVMAGSLSITVASDQTAIPVTTTPAVKDFGVTTNAERIAAIVGNVSGVNTSANPMFTELTDGTHTASISAANALKVDGSAVTQPVSGTVAATQSGNWSVRNQDGAGAALTSTLIGGTKQSLDVNVANTTAIPVTTTPGTLDFGTSTTAGRVAALIGNASGANSATNPVLNQLTDGTTAYVGTKTGQLPTTLGQTTMAASTSVTIASNQSSVPVTNTPATLDFGASAAAGRVAALIGNASGANTAANPVLAELSDGTSAYTTVKTAQIPTTLGQTTMAGSLAVTIASNQSALAVTTAPNVSDFGATTSAQRVAAVIGNTTGAIDYNSGAAGAQTPRSVLATRHEAAATPLAAELSDGSAFYTTVKTAQIPAALGQTTMAASLAVTVASNQSAIPVTFTPATVDFGATTNAQRVAALIGVGTTAAGQTNPVPSRLGDGTDYIDAAAIAASQKTISTATKTLETTTFNLGWDGTTHREIAVDTNGFLKTVASGAAGRTYSDSARLDFSSTNVTTGAWVQLIASTAASATQLNVFSGTGECLELGTGAAASETRILLIPPGGFDNPIDLTIASATRVSVRAVSATASVGSLVLNLRS